MKILDKMKTYQKLKQEYSDKQVQYAFDKITEYITDKDKSEMFMQEMTLCNTFSLARILDKHTMIVFKDWKKLSKKLAKEHGLMIRAFDKYLCLVPSKFRLRYLTAWLRTKF